MKTETVPLRDEDIETIWHRGGAATVTADADGADADGDDADGADADGDDGDATDAADGDS